MQTIQCLALSAALLATVTGDLHGSVITLTSDWQEATPPGALAPSGRGFQRIMDFENIDYTIGDVVGRRSASFTANYRQPNANSVVLRWDTGLVHDGEDWTLILTTVVTQFVADQASLTYEIDGRWNVDGVFDAPYTFQRDWLYDLTTGEILFDSHQLSRYTINPEFSVGAGGDHVNVVVGNKVGSLKLGHRYEWSSHTSINRSDEYTEGGAVGYGFRTLTISTNTTEVPEPASLLLYVFGAAALATARSLRLANAAIVPVAGSCMDGSN